MRLHRNPERDPASRRIAEGGDVRRIDEMRFCQIGQGPERVLDATRDVTPFRHAGVFQASRRKTTRREHNMAPSRIAWASCR